MSRKATEKVHPGWQLALKNLTPLVGKSLKDGKYELIRVDERGFTLSRVATGKEVRISRRMVENTFDRLKAGEKLAKQANQTKGGISFTIAVEFGVVSALEGFVDYDAKKRLWIRKKGSKIKELIATAALLLMVSA